MDEYEKSSDERACVDKDQLLGPCAKSRVLRTLSFREADLVLATYVGLRFRGRYR